MFCLSILISIKRKNCICSHQTEHLSSSTRLVAQQSSTETTLFHDQTVKLKHKWAIRLLIIFSHLKFITPLHTDIKTHDKWRAYEPTNNLPDGVNVSPDKHIFSHKQTHSHWKKDKHTHAQFSNRDILTNRKQYGERGNHSNPKAQRFVTET